MKKFWILLLIPFLLAAAPSRVNIYTADTTIESAAVEGNEDAIFTYLQQGVDTYADGTLVNADVNTSAAIAASKLNLSSVTQDMTLTGTITTASLIATANLDIGAYDFRANTLIADDLTSGRVVFTTTNGQLVDDSDLSFATDTLTVTKLGAFEATGAINFGSQAMTSVDINSGTVNGITSLGMTTVTGITDILDEDAMGSDSATALATQQSIKAYADTKSKIEIFTSDDTWTVPAGITTAYITMCAGGGGGGGGEDGGNRGGAGGNAGNYIINYPLTVTPAAELTVTVGGGGAGGAGSATGVDGTVGDDSVFDSITVTGGNPGQRGSDDAAATAQPGMSTSSIAAGIFQMAGGAGSIGADTGTSTGGGGGGGFGGSGTAGGAANTASTNAAANSCAGAGGGGANNGKAGGTGGSGIVIIYY